MSEDCHFYSAWILIDVYYIRSGAAFSLPDKKSGLPEDDLIRSNLIAPSLSRGGYNRRLWG